MKTTLAVVGLSCATSLHATEIIAHRGASYDAAENTVAAAKLAWEQNADALEFDIHLTGDGKIITIHDRTTERTTGVAGRVAEMTFAELRTLEAGSWKDPAFAGEKLPTLEEMIETTPPGKRVFVELKGGPAIVPPVTEILSASELENNQLVIIAFNYNTISASKKAMPDYEAYWLVNYEPDEETGRPPLELEDLIRKAKKAGLDGLNLDYHWPIDNDFVEQIHAADLKLYTYTVNDAEVARSHVEMGVDGITTDRPGWLREQLGL